MTTTTESDRVPTVGDWALGDSPGMIYGDVTQTVGNTPLVRLNRLPRAGGAEVLVKLEYENPGGSVKDRIGVAIINEAERSGALRPGGTIVEGTSGNTGIALAMVGAARGYRVVITMPDSVSQERRQVAEAFGAEVDVLSSDRGITVVERAEELARLIPGAVLGHQFSSAANAEIHRRTTAQEILRDTGGVVDIFVAGIGTGGTITGVGQVLKARVPGVEVIAVEPAESPLLACGAAGTHGIQGIGVNFVPEVLDTQIYDEIFHVSTDEALQTARELAAREGIFSGISSGAIVRAAVEIAARPENRDKRIVAMVCDWGERYLSTDLWSAG